jgi:hypothetical protein
MDDVAFVRERIESYADYTNDDARRLADEQIRAYVGEALARVRERLAPTGVAAETLEGVLLRCQFADQAVIRALDDDVTADDLAALHAFDRELVGLADGADVIEKAGLDAYVARVDATIERRARLVISAAAPAPPVL